MRKLILLAVGAIAAMSRPSPAGTTSVTLVRDKQPTATIVTAKAPSPSARLAALEVQHHVQRVAGTLLPIRTDADPVEGARILVGESKATRALGLKGAGFELQEYLIRFLPDTVVLIGRDWQDTSANRAEAGRGTNWQSTLADWRHQIDYGAAVGGKPHGAKIELPGLFDDQGTCYAAYDFLERFCGVRWYGPTPLNVVAPTTGDLTVKGGDVRRRPALLYREGFGGGWPIIKAQWSNPTADQLNLYWRRLRVGGEKWAGNHSFMSFQDRFLRKNPKRPELWEGARPDFFAQGRGGGPGSRQLCLTNPALIQQVAKDARDFFGGKGIKGYQLAMGDHFAIVPLDNAAWCTCARCQAVVDKDRNNRNAGHFNSGTGTHYIFGFINAVAREVRKTHPGKRIVALAYHVYAFRPTEFDLEPNVAVAPCLQVRNYWAPRIRGHEMRFYKAWVEPRDRPIYLWNYYCFPMEPAVMRGWHCFPGFSARRLGRLIKMYHADGVRGVFLCGIGEQVDYYLTMKMYDDPSLDPDALLDEFFTSYFGAAADPMKRFYSRIEETYSDPANYPGAVRTQDAQFHQTEEIAWVYLGTKQRMAELGGYMERAKALASTDLERQRVATWDRGVWQYMVEGKRKHNTRIGLIRKPPPHASVAEGFIQDVRVRPSAEPDRPAWTVVNSHQMVEAKKGVLGTKEAKLVAQNADHDRHWIATGPDGVWIQFDLGKPHKVDEVRIWNYKQNRGYGLTRRGMRAVKIACSATEDLANWESLGAFTLPQANDRGPSPVSLVLPTKGKVFRFLRITAVGGVGKGNWWTQGQKDTYAGLGQVRFYGRPVGN